MPASEPLTEEAIIEKLSSWIVRKGLTTFAIIMIEGHRPLNFVASQMFLMLQPALSILFDPFALDQVQKMMEKRENVEALLIAIEKKDLALQEKQRAEKKARREARRQRREAKRAAKLARRETYE
jgi:hypothetical protein